VDDDDKRLAHEETLAVQKEIRDAISSGSIIRIPQAVDAEKLKSDIVNEITTKLLKRFDDSSTSDTDRIESLKEHVNKQLEVAIAEVSKTIEKAKPEATTEMKVSNIADAKADEVSITNFADIQKFFTDLGELVKQVRPKVEVTQKEIKLPNSRKEYISVRLTDGKDFYDAKSGDVGIAVGGGNPVNTDPTVGYQIADTDDASNPKYYGFVNSKGAWYILRENTSTKTYRYATGIPDKENGGGLYTDAWNDRANLTYGYFYEVW